MDIYKKLMSLKPYGISEQQKNKILLEALSESYKYHFQNCEPYRKYCLKREVDAHTKFHSIESIPFLPIQAFKEYGEFLITKNESNKNNFLLRSSATSGRASTISVDRETAKRQVQVMTRCLSNFLGNSKVKFIVADVDPKSSSKEVLGARAAATLGFLNFSKEALYILNTNKFGQLELDVNKLLKELREIQKTGEKFVFFGFTYVLFDAILSKINLVDSFNFSNNGFFLHIGGWKKLEAQKISKADFNGRVFNALGIMPDHIVDVYGFTEQMGVIYPSIGLDDKVCSTYSDVLVRDPETLEVLENGKEGVLQFLSPMPTSYPGISILTDDLGVITDPIEIDGVFHKAFRVTGRIKNAEIRGCGDVMSTYVEVIKDVKVQEDLGNNKIYCLWSSNFSLDSKEYLDQGSNSKYLHVDSIDEIASLVKNGRNCLSLYSSDELIAYFSEASKLWLMDSSPLSKFKNEGLTFLSNWLNSQNMRMTMNYSFGGSRDILDKFKKDKYNELRYIRAVPRGVVVHWLAGNVPLLGMLALAQSIIAKNVNILKAPSHNSGIMPALLNEIKKTNIALENGKIVLGENIANSIAVIYFDRNNINAAMNLSKLADLRVAWGGSDAITSVLALPKKHTTEDVIFGPKLSYMAIGKEFLSRDININKLLKKISIDCSVFDQYACASPHTIFVENGGDISAKEFAQLLIPYMDKAAIRIPKNKIDGGTIGNIYSKRMLYEFTENVWSSSGTTWTILFDNKGEEGLVSPTYSRVITIRSIDNIMQAATFATQDIQTIALGMGKERGFEFADIAARYGACRFPEIGRMTHFDTPWDGLNLMQRLVRFISFGGPSV